MDIFDSQPQSISYGEYQTTSSKGIKSQAYENENISNNLENYIFYPIKIYFKMIKIVVNNYNFYSVEFEN